MNLFLKCLRKVSFQLVSSVQISLVLPVYLSISSCLPVQKSRMSSTVAKTQPASKILPAKPIPELKAKIQLPETLPERVKAWQLIVDEAIKEHGTALFGAGECEKFTEEWVLKVKAELGINLHWSRSEGFGVLTTLEGEEFRRDLLHAFATDRGLCKGDESCAEEIIIDASYLQFIEGGECRIEPKLEACSFLPPSAYLPPVLVGSQSDIVEFYSDLKHRVEFPSSFMKDSFKEFLPKSAPSFIYSFSINSSRRVNMNVFQK